MSSINSKIANEVPERISDSEVLQHLKRGQVDHRYLHYFKQQSNISDETLSSWFNINVKTFRTYKRNENALKENLQEHIILLISIFKHGAEVFGSNQLFSKWLNEENFFFDGDKPIQLLRTITGIRFIEDRLTAIEYGDNV